MGVRGKTPRNVLILTHYMLEKDFEDGSAGGQDECGKLCLPMGDPRSSSVSSRGHRSSLAFTTARGADGAGAVVGRRRSRIGAPSESPQGISRIILSLCSRYLCANCTASEVSHLAMHSLMHRCGMDGSIEGAETETVGLGHGCGEQSLCIKTSLTSLGFVTREILYIYHREKEYDCGRHRSLNSPIILPSQINRLPSLGLLTLKPMLATT